MAVDKKFGLMVEMKSDIKKFQSGMGAAKASTKQFGGAFKGIMGQATAQFGAMTGGMGRGLGVMKSMIPAIKGIKMALISSGIGAIVVAIGIAFAAVSTNINRSAKASDQWKQKMGLLKGTMDVLLDRLANLGGAVVKFIQGDFKGAWQDAKTAVKGVVDEIKTEAKVRQDLVKREQALRDKRRAWMVEEAKLLAEKADLILLSRDITKSSTERQEILNKALRIQKLIGQENIAIAKEDLGIQEASMDLGINSNKDLDRQAELKKALFEVSKRQADVEREVVNRIREAGVALSVNEKLAKKLYVGIADIVDEVTEFKDELIQMEAIKLDAEQLGIDDIAQSLSAATYLTAKWREELAMLQEQGPTLGQVLDASIASNVDALADSLIGGAANFKEYGAQMKSAAKDIIGAQLAQATAALVSRAIQDAALTPFVGLLLAPILAAAAGGIVRTAFNSLIPDFASGAIVSGDTLARVGEYPGARSNPEVIAPLSKLQGMLGDGGGEVVFVIKGDVLEGVRKNYYQRQNLMR